MLYQHFDLKTLEQEYSPSSCIDDINLYIQQYIDQSKTALLNAQMNNKVHVNLPYGKNKDEVLDLFLPFDPAHSKQKLQVYIHGGYWQELSKNESSFAASNFQQQGYHFAVLNYSLAPKATLTEIVEQNRRALIWLYHHANKYGYDNNEIYLSGSSAGGHLAMMMAFTDWSKYLNVNHTIIKGICAVSGIYDLTPIAHTYINAPLQLTDKEVKEYSPALLKVNNTQLQSCSIIFAYGDNETQEFKRQSVAMKNKLDEQNLTTIIAEIKNRNHFDIIVDLANETSWLSQQVFLQMK
ncbi:alpha/beta hydrolase [Colwelliaceae bacterium 6441]